MTSPLTSVSWLNANLGSPDLVMLFTSKKDLSNSLSEIKLVPGSRYFDLKNVFSDQESPYPNTFPSPGQFQSECQKIGINKNSHIIIYETEEIFNGPRIWWMFKAMGHEKVQLLDGGFPEWAQEGHQTTIGTETNYQKGDFIAHLQSDSVIYLNDVIANIKSEESLVLDARSAGRFSGSSPEPREGIKSGSISKSKNLPFNEVLKNGKFQDPDTLKTLLTDLNPSSRPMTFTCGSGVTACIILMAAELAGYKNLSVYDGSWTEWATENKLFTE